MTAQLEALVLTDPNFSSECECIDCYCYCCGLVAAEGAVVDIVRRWHNEAHPGAFRVCDQQPCDAILRLDVADWA